MNANGLLVGEAAEFYQNASLKPKCSVFTE